MAAAVKTKLVEILEQDEAAIVTDWVKEQLAAVTARPDLMKEAELREQSRQFVNLLRAAVLGSEVLDIQRPSWTAVRDLLGDISRSRALQGFSSSETATFVLSLKQPLFARLRGRHDVPEALADDYWLATVLLDKLGLYTVEVFQKSREDFIRRQQQELFELSVPVVELWQGILALPMIGTLDSKRTQLMMETLLERIAATQADVAIIDITGVPTVDTLTAQHLLKTAHATRLMGAECMISGVRAQIAQTMADMGIMFTGIVTKATMAGALEIALARRGVSARSVPPSPGSGG